MDNDFDLTALRVFHSVVRSGSFSAAARDLGAPRSTVAKKVADLESSLGVRLVERTTRSMRVTTEGEVLASRAERLLADASDLRRRLTDAGQAPRGHLRVGMPELFEQISMGPIAAHFRHRYPEITLELVTSRQPGDLIEAELDAIIAFGPLPESSLVARQLIKGSMTTVAAPGLPGLDAVRHPRDLDGMPLIDVPQHWIRQWAFVRGDEEEVLRITPVLTFGSMLTARDAAVAGGGVTKIPTILARPEIAAGRLVEVLPDWRGPAKDLFVVFPSARSVTTRLRAFLDVLREHVEAAAAARRQD
ncbi:LysR family transcriptional regulator [Pseudooceanicola nanhaiensis]|jgi:DNA-binding transcriptional LysR family regulator|uniref:LysR family transcriptional regulator n=1 Tax=Pseudooceanicola nanhaiensis TaxID=375761 RepID=A0A917SPE9_9RHOB|nr:LysR family transcriptional regulator [Pseudooceanicola nanhaiensis]GGL88790.1 LysR family transcriptional regulator [Pseudooceanicola nanhaiensis]